MCLSVTLMWCLNVTNVIAKGHRQARCEMQGLWNNLSQVLQRLCGS